MVGGIGIFELDLLNDSLQVVQNATVTVRKESDGLLATVFSDISGTGMTNPISVTTGRLAFYAAFDELYRVEIVSGAFTRTLRYRAVQFAVNVVPQGEIFVSANDTTSGFISTKLTGDSNITFTITNPSSNEGLQASLAADISVNSITGTAGTGLLLGSNIDAESTHTIVNLVDPTSAQDAATKAYSDIKAGTAVATTSGTAINFGSLPAGIRRLTLVFDKVSTNGTGSNFVRIGTSGGLATTGYSGSLTTLVAASVTTASTTSAFGFESGGASVTAASTRSGRMVIERLTGNIWVATTRIGLGNTGAVYVACTSVDIGAELTQVELTNTGGNTYDGGNLNVLWEF